MSISSIRTDSSIAAALWRVLIGLFFCVIAPAGWTQTAPTFTSPLPPNGTVAAAYTHTFAASGTDPVAFSLTGTLPPGLSFNRMLAARAAHTATPLANGKVLVAAGVVSVSSGGFFNSAELFDPATNTWSAAGSLTAGRGYHTATRLANGKVLVVGGLGVNPMAVPPMRLDSAEIYDPATNAWSAVGSLATARAHHSATLLANGKVLVAGGSSNNANLPVNSAELFDPATNTWSAAGSFLVERQDHEAVLLPNGRVLLAGGGNNISGSLASAELYDPATNTWSAAASLARARNYLTATLLANGKVLAAGGFDQLGIGVVASAELYDPATNSWSAAGSLGNGRYEHTATLLPNGQVLVAGGFGSSLLASAELYDPATNAWSATGSLAKARYMHAAAPLVSGNVLATGGLDAASANIAGAEFYDVPSGTWRMPGVISGVPTTAGSYSATAQAANGTLPNATQSFTIVIGAPTPGPYAYITNSGSNNVSVIDTATNTVTATVAVGTSPFAVAVNAAGARAFVANFGSNNVSAIDASNSVAATVAVGTSPQGIALNPAGTRAYVANVGSNTTVSVIDTANSSVVATVTVGTEPLGVAVHPNGTRAYVANRLSNSVSVIDTATNTVTATVAVGVNPYGVAVNPAGTRAYVANRFVNNLSVIDTATNTIAATVAVGTGPQGVGVNPAGTRVYVANNGSNNVSVIDTATNTVVATVAVGTSPIGVAVNPAGTRAYVANFGSNNVSVIDTATNSVIATVAVGTAPAAFGAFIGTPAAAMTVPGAPSIGAATAGVGSASVAFTPPAGDGGSPITGYQVTSSPGGITANGAASPVTVTGLTAGTPYTFTVNAINAIGTGPASAASNSVTPTAVTFTVTPSAGANGSITPSTPQNIASGATTTFTVIPAAGYAATVAGTCGGTLVGATYTTAAITGACTVAASFALIPPATFTVTPSAGANGSITPSTPQNIASGTTTTFTVIPAAGYAATVAGTCGGALVGTTYTTAAITGPCTVAASFALIPPATFLLTVTSTGAGSVSANPVGIACPGDCTELYNSGTAVTLTASANSGSTFTGWGGDCSGTGSCTVTMNAVRSVSATFSANPPGGVALTSSSNPSIYRSHLILAADIQGTNPTGSVTFAINAASGSVTLCPAVPLISARATCPVPAQLIVTSPITFTVSYSGDANNPPGTVSHQQFVNAGSVSLSVATTPIQPVVGASVVLRATVSGVSLSNKVQFNENGTALPGCGAVAIAPLPGAADIGVASCTITGITTGLHNYVVTYLHATDAGFEQVVVPVTPLVAAAGDFTDMWWAGQGENGWGVSIAQHGRLQFIVLFVYDSSGKPVWYVLPNGTWNAANTAYTGALYQPSSSPFSRYRAGDFIAGAPVGSATITYTGTGTGTLAYTINGVSGSKAIVRQAFAAETGNDRMQVNDMWWAGAGENGWGMNIAQQGRMLFPVWYTYDATGRTVFYAVPGGTWSGSSFSGDIYSTVGSPWLGTTYDPTKFVVTKVGTMTLDFTDQNTAVMSYTIGNVMQRRLITRQAF